MKTSDEERAEETASDIWDRYRDATGKTLMEVLSDLSDFWLDPETILLDWIDDEYQTEDFRDYLEKYYGNANDE